MASLITFTVISSFNAVVTYFFCTVSPYQNINGFLLGGSGKDGNAFGISDTVGSILSFAGGRGATNPSLLIHHPEEGQV